MNRIYPLDSVELNKQLKQSQFLNSSIKPSPSLASSLSSESEDSILQAGCGCCCCAPGTIFSTFCSDNCTRLSKFLKYYINSL